VVNVFPGTISTLQYASQQLIFYENLYFSMDYKNGCYAHIMLESEKNKRGGKLERGIL
jgi:hypothetical protein